LVDAEGLMFGSVVCLVGVAARFCCLKRGCKTAEKRREKKETGSLTTNNTPWTCNRTEAADECLLGRVEQGGGSITLALYMQAACRRQPLKRDLCCSTCTIFHLDRPCIVSFHLFISLLSPLSQSSPRSGKKCLLFAAEPFLRPLLAAATIRAHFEMLVCFCVLV
jgi:hypothetical protein